MSNSEIIREDKARYEAGKQGFILEKSKARYWSENNQQMYKIIDETSGIDIEGRCFNMTLEAVEEFLNIAD